MRTSSDRLKLLAFIVVTTLLLIIGYRRPTGRTASKPAPDSVRAAAQPVSESTTASDAPAVATMPTFPPAERVSEPPKPSPPARTVPPASPRPVVSRPVLPAPNPAEPVRKPTPVPCAQLILRNGDLVDALVTEIGIREVTYKKCHLPDGPNYVILRTEVLSVRFANGEVERL